MSTGDRREEIGEDESWVLGEVPGWILAWLHRCFEGWLGGLSREGVRFGGGKIAGLREKRH